MVLNCVLHKTLHSLKGKTSPTAELVLHFQNAGQIGQLPLTHRVELTYSSQQSQDTNSVDISLYKEHHWHLDEDLSLAS